MRNNDLNTTVKQRSEVHPVSRSPDVGVRKLQPKPARNHILCVDTQSQREEVRHARQVGLLGHNGDRLQVCCKPPLAQAPAFCQSCRWIMVSGRAVNLTIKPHSSGTPGRPLGYLRFSRRKQTIPTLFGLALTPSGHQNGRISLCFGLYK